MEGFDIGYIGTHEEHVGDVVGGQTFFCGGFVADQADDGVGWVGGEVFEPGVAETSTGAGDEVGWHG